MVDWKLRAEIPPEHPLLQTLKNCNTPARALRMAGSIPGRLAAGAGIKPAYFCAHKWDRHARIGILSVHEIGLRTSSPLVDARITAVSTEILAFIVQFSAAVLTSARHDAHLPSYVDKRVEKVEKEIAQHFVILA